MIKSILNGLRTFSIPLWLILGVLVGEALLDLLIIRKIPYTEIDWVAYMDEVGGVMKGEYNYSMLKGDTGPLVYPAGFVWLFMLLRMATNEGNIQQAQYAFAVIHVLTVFVVLMMYRRGRCVPLWALPFVFLSRRIHSIFVLRMFNDCIAIMFAYACVTFAASKRFTLSTICLTLGISIKMNVLLFAPAGLLILYHSKGVVSTILHGLLVVLIQIGLAIPFLQVAPRDYLSKAFEFSRIFFHKWTVNLQFLPNEIFQSTELATALLALHVSLLFVFGMKWWQSLRKGLNPRQTVVFLLISNFIGIACARTLHYQFYVWYAHSLPALLWSTGAPAWLNLTLWTAIEVVFNLYPPTGAASIVLQLAHWSLVFLLLRVDPRRLK